MQTYILYSFFCLAWGTTWIAIKLGVTNAPPLIFAGSRFFVAGIILLTYVLYRNKKLSIDFLKNPYLYLCSIMMIGLCFGLIFWGENYVSAGLTAIIVQGLIPLTLPFFHEILRLEKFSIKTPIVASIGIIGLCFAFNGSSGNSEHEFLGIAALVIGTVIYCFGSSISKKKIKNVSVIEYSAYQNLIGGASILLMSICFESEELKNFNFMSNTVVIYAWIYLVIIGSLFGFTLYLYFLKIWPSTKVVAYTFITPCIALFIDSFFFGNILQNNQLIGSGIMLFAVFLTFIPTKWWSTVFPRVGK
jgi:drug/metabolite transporter (DMT)-like permease